jgi:hypothetical protein
MGVTVIEHFIHSRRGILSVANSGVELHCGVQRLSEVNIKEKRIK